MRVVVVVVVAIALLERGGGWRWCAYVNVCMSLRGSQSLVSQGDSGMCYAFAVGTLSITMSYVLHSHNSIL